MSRRLESKTKQGMKNLENKEALYKRTLIIVVISQMFGGAGLAAGISVGALLAEQMLGTDAFSGIPSALFTLGSAGAALLVGRLSNRFGRRLGLSTGFIVGGLGALGVILAAVLNNIILLFISLLIYGAGTATNLQARYAGTDLAEDNQRGRAVSTAMVSTTLGAVAGPNLVDVMGEIATSIGVPELAGPFILSAVAYTLAGIILFIFLRPDPFIVAIEMNQEKTKTSTSSNIKEEAEVNRNGIFVGAFIMVLTQMIMLAIMTMTPVHMGMYGHSLRASGFVIGFHIGSMYLPSLVTGALVDRIGWPIMSIASGVTLFLAGIIAAIAPGESLFLLTIALSLLGIGWNFGLISGTALIVDSTVSINRAQTQGTVDIFIALGGALAGALSGVILSNFSYEILSLMGGIISLILIPVVIWFVKNDTQVEI